MIPLSAEEAGRALGLGPLAAAVSGISIDSRSVHPGDLFVALRGERFDGHDYVEAALAGGASGAVVERATWVGRKPGRAGLPIYEVDDALAALWALAREVRRKSRARVFAITGSVGKTSTKDLLHAMVARTCRVVATAANQNNEVGVPLTLLAMDPDTEAVVVEMGMRGAGQIAGLAGIAEPDVGIVTNIHPVHLELLGTLERIAEAKAELIAAVKPGGTVVVPRRCGLLQPYVADAGCRTVDFAVGSEAGEADVVGFLESRGGGSGSVLSLRWPDGNVEMEIPHLPAYALENVVAGIAACYAAGLPVEECAAGIRDVRYSEKRGNVMDLTGLCVIDDTYNANPAAVRAALDNLVRVATARGGRSVAVLGAMLELGPDAERYHREVGAYAAEVGVVALWGVGPEARATVEGFRTAWQARPGRDCEWVAGHLDSVEETSRVVAGLRPGDVVLFKASRSVRLESMVDLIVGEAEAGTWSPCADGTGERKDGTEGMETC